MYLSDVCEVDENWRGTIVPLVYIGIGGSGL